MGWGFELIDVDVAPAACSPLRGVSLGARMGEVTAVVGADGAGKTTVFRLLAGLERPARGAVFVAGRDIARASRRDVRRTQRRMAVVFGARERSYGLFAGTTVRENVEYAMRTAGRVPRRRLRDVADEELARFGIEHLAQRSAESLEERDRKALALARASALRAPLVLVDDLEAGLGGNGLKRVCEVVREDARRYGTTWLVTTAVPAVAASVGDAIEQL